MSKDDKRNPVFEAAEREPHFRGIAWMDRQAVKTVVEDGGADWNDFEARVSAAFKRDSSCLSMEDYSREFEAHIAAEAGKAQRPWGARAAKEGWGADERAKQLEGHQDLSGGSMLPGEAVYTTAEHVPPPPSSLPRGSQARKDTPLYSGVLRYFPAALAAVARVSDTGNRKHNPGEPLHWARGKSADEGDALLRHLIDADEAGRDEDGVPHVAYLAWRALAFAQKWLEEHDGAPLPKGAKAAPDQNQG